MGYLDYAGLQYLWGKLKEKFAPKSHSHDDRYYTESEVNTKLNGKSNTGHTHDDRYYTESEVDSKLGTKSSSGHTHGLNSSSLAKTVDNVTTNSWDMVGGNKGFLLQSLRMQAKVPDWLEGNYAAGIAFGGSDTKGVISHAYGSPAIKFAGGNGAAPVWWLRLTGTTGKTYNLDVMPKASAADSATTASKLSTSAGSATQPVYFKDGVPVATTYTLNKTVPSDAKFTDTNTWRGIQNNLTSDSADQSLSAAQGKVLKGMVDGKLGKNEKASSATTADKATKLATARTVSGGTDITLSFNYDGSANSTANIGFYSCKHIVGNTNNYPFHRFAKLDNLTGAYVDETMLVYITQDYNDGGFGICRLSLRTNNSSSASTVEARWLVRRGLSADFVQVAIYNVYGKTYADAFIKINGGYGSTTISALESGARGAKHRTWTLVDSDEVYGTTATDKKTSSECWKTIAEAGTALHNQAYSNTASAVDSGYVNSAGTSNSCTGNAATATGVKDYGDTNKTIKIGYAGAGLTTSNLTHIAGYASNGTQIKDVSKTVLQDWIDLNGMINKLSEATVDPQDNDYYISQYSGGGTTTTTYHRRPVKALWNYIKGKADGVYLKLTGGAISGRITHNGGGSWISSRDQVAVFGIKSGKDSFNPVVGQKTPKGAWAMGNLGENEQLCFGYTTDENYNAGSNNAVQVWLPAQAGTIITSATIGSQTVSKASSATTASKLGTNAGSTTNPVYFKDGVPVAGTYTLSDASTKTVRTLTAQGPSGWKDAETDQKYVPDMAFMAYWNGAYSGTSSNLQYCDHGRFGTIITKGSGDYLPIGGGTLTGDLKFSDIGDTATSHKISWAGSTDGADIYYQTTAKDQGNLVLNLRDDANCYLRIASNGAFKSYFSPSDGNFHGNVNGKADTAGTADKANSVAWANVSGKPTIPAAAISASGKNYVRFSDGTQLCWGTYTCGKKITQVTVTFPQSFLNTNYIFYAFSDYNIHNINIYFKNKSTTKMLCDIDAYDTAYSSIDYSYFAIGRWK